MTPAMDLRDASTLHQLTLQAEGLSLQTQRNYLFYQRLFLRFLEEQDIDPTLDALNATNVRDALTWYRARPNARRHRGGEIAAQSFVDQMRLWARFLEREQVLAYDPLSKVRRVKVTKHLREPFSQTELNALLGASQQSAQPARDQALFLLLLDTGMRIGEACYLTLDRLRLAERQVLVGARGKGRRERIVPIGQVDVRGGGPTLDALRRYLAERHQVAERHSDRTGNRLFLSRDGYPLEPEGGSDVIARLGEAAGVENCFAHRCRHSFATWYLISFPGDEIGLRRIIGHLSKDVLADYVHMSQAVIAQRAGTASLAATLMRPGANRGLVTSRLNGRAGSPLPPTRERRRAPEVDPWRDEPARGEWDDSTTRGRAPRRNGVPAPRPPEPRTVEDFMDQLLSDPDLLREFATRYQERRTARR